MKVFITGTSKGLGWGLANHYLNIGYDVVGLSRSIPKDLAENKKYKHITVDLQYLEKIEFNLNPYIKSIVSDLDLVILNAGILGEIKELDNTEIKELNTLIDINLWSNKIIIDLLLKEENTIKQIVAISSGASINGSKGWGGYSISKAALNMMIKLYASENDNIHFTSLAPGLIDTSMQDYLCGKVDEHKFPSAKRLKESRGTDLMPSPIKAGIIVANGIEKSKNITSGSYVDVRKI